MIANVKARYANGVLTPLEPLDLEEGQEVVVSIGTRRWSSQPRRRSPSWRCLTGSGSPSLRDTWDNMPTDGAKNYRHYLYGHPKVED